MCITLTTQQWHALNEKYKPNAIRIFDNDAYRVRKWFGPYTLEKGYLFLVRETIFKDGETEFEYYGEAELIEDTSQCPA